jgi:hypothetical protein
VAVAVARSAFFLAKIAKIAKIARIYWIHSGHMLIFWDRSNRQVRALQFVPVAVDVAVAEEVEFNHEDHEDHED